jgi:hypothetical protein
MPPTCTRHVRFSHIALFDIDTSKKPVVVALAQPTRHSESDADDALLDNTSFDSSPDSMSPRGREVRRQVIHVVASMTARDDDEDLGEHARAELAELDSHTSPAITTASPSSSASHEMVASDHTSSAESLRSDRAAAW